MGPASGAAGRWLRSDRKVCTGLESLRFPVLDGGWGGAWGLWVGALSGKLMF